jgi:hypothetical protein
MEFENNCDSCKKWNLKIIVNALLFTVKKLKKDKMTNSPRRNKNRIRNGKFH